VLLAAMLEQHRDHGRCLPWLQRAQRGALELQVAAHSIAELYAVLSSYPTRPRISTAAAARLIRENVIATASVIALTGTDYAAVISRLAERSLPGGVVYDALIAQAALKAGADRLVTLNPRDFQRVWTGPATALVAP
jgi:predicted nucleic acid-binding protein